VTPTKHPYWVLEAMVEHLSRRVEGLEGELERERDAWADRAIDAEFAPEHDGHGSKYERFFDGRLWRLELGRDCPRSRVYARSSIDQAARSRGLRVQTRVLGTQLFLRAIERAACDPVS